jgi:hypothetical protein
MTAFVCLLELIALVGFIGLGHCQHYELCETFDTTLCLVDLATETVLRGTPAISLRKQINIPNLRKDLNTVCEGCLIEIVSGAHYFMKSADPSLANSPWDR